MNHSLQHTAVLTGGGFLHCRPYLLPLYGQTGQGIEDDDDDDDDEDDDYDDDDDDIVTVIRDRRCVEKCRILNRVV
ncbi:hypothetical protein DPMN_164122 [Dreissena polymorpha]|uniref:Uncharacterized protein n=1 Tax=Dreissena polymorpha TaxID=45954 RepID=A0A9D4EUK2_DREPO|nr:hypothetical protein DPMN_164122 [Dreissena polymorpha]